MSVIGEDQLTTSAHALSLFKFSVQKSYIAGKRTSEAG